MWKSAGTPGEFFNPLLLAVGLVAPSLSSTLSFNNKDPTDSAVRGLNNGDLHFVLMAGVVQPHRWCIEPEVRDKVYMNTYSEAAISNLTSMGRVMGIIRLPSFNHC